MKLFGTVVVLVPILTASLPAAVISTIPSWNGSDAISSFGVPNSQTFGQTITAPSSGGSVLQSFAFEFKLPTALKFRGEVYAWDQTNSRASGANLYESATVQTTIGDAFQLISFNTGNLSLTPGGLYVIFVTTSKDTSTGTGAPCGTATLGGCAGSVSGAAYSGGSFFSLSNGTDTTQWTSNSWSQFFVPSSLAFSAQFGSGSTATPEPASWTLAGAALLAAVVVRTRFR